MIIQADVKGKEAISQLCDIALRASGINVLNNINQVLLSIQPYKEPKKESLKVVNPDIEDLETKKPKSKKETKK